MCGDGRLSSYAHPREEVAGAVPFGAALTRVQENGIVVKVDHRTAEEKPSGKQYSLPTEVLQRVSATRTSRCGLSLEANNTNFRSSGFLGMDFIAGHSNTLLSLYAVRGRYLDLRKCLSPPFATSTFAHNINPTTIAPTKPAYAIDTPARMFLATLFDVPPPIPSVPVCSGAGLFALQVTPAE